MQDSDQDLYKKASKGKTGTFTGFGLILGMMMENVTYFVAAGFGGKWANEKYPREFDWFIVFILIAVCLSMFSLYRVFRFMMNK